MNKIIGKYDDVIKFVIDLKEQAYEETKDLNFKEYLKYIREDIKEIKRKTMENKLEICETK